MRGLMFTLALVVTTAVVGAQQRMPSHPIAPPPPAPPVAHRPPHVPNTSPTVLPFPPLPTQPTGGFTSGVVFPPQVNPAYRPRFNGRGSYGRYGGGYGYAGGYFSSPDVQPATAAPMSAPEPTGSLRLSGTPSEAQVFIDGYYVTTLADAEAERALTLAAGPHHIELRAPDYTTAAFDVRIDPNGMTSYHASLDHVRAPAPPRPASPAAGATKMYLIPNCYLGNIPPRADRLPQGCDIKRVQIIS
jgi:hypothetical protein